MNYVKINMIAFWQNEANRLLFLTEFYFKTSRTTLVTFFLRFLVPITSFYYVLLIHAESIHADQIFKTLFTNLHNSKSIFTRIILKSVRFFYTYYFPTHVHCMYFFYVLLIIPLLLGYYACQLFLFGQYRKECRDYGFQDWIYSSTISQPTSFIICS